MTLPWYLWAGGASAVGLTEAKIDKVRCTHPGCGRWTRSPAWYGPPNLGPAAIGETERILCPRHHAPLVAKAKTWAGVDERSDP